MIILVYYQTDLVEDILRMDNSFRMESHLQEMNYEIQHNWGEPLWARVDYETTIAKHVSAKDIIGRSPLKKQYEGFQSNDPSKFAYQTSILGSSNSSARDRAPDRADTKAELMAIFRKDHCVNGTLQHKGIDVRPDMAEHVFREFKPANEWSRCNPCDETCTFSIIEEKLNTETKMLPVDSNDFLQKNVKYMQNAFSQVSDNFTDYLKGDHFASFM